MLFALGAMFVVLAVAVKVRGGRRVAAGVKAPVSVVVPLRHERASYARYPAAGLTRRRMR